MRHEVPQFIDIEDKIFGPLTFIQGLYLIGGFFGAFSIYYITGLLWDSAPVFVKVSLGIPIFALGIALAFLKINKRSFIKYMEAWFYFTINPKKYIWKKQEEKKRNINQNMNDDNDDFILPGEVREATIQIAGPDEERNGMRRSKLKSLAHSLDMDMN